MKKKIILISDTHGLHKHITDDLMELYNEYGDDIIILHGGDISNRGLVNEINYFTEWYGTLPFKHKVFIAGNHDFGFEEIRHRNEPGIFIPDNVIYIQDEMVEVDGIKIYGSPWQPRFYDWAFNVDRGDAIAEKWKLIPTDADIVITHGPVHGIVDSTPQGLRVGCEELYKKIIEIKPKIHLSGHIHHSRGYREFNDTLFVNACCLNERYTYQNKPLMIEYDFETRDWDLLNY
jgi:Icc-related predicted phosphoesterase